MKNDFQKGHISEELYNFGLSIFCWKKTTFFYSLIYKNSIFIVNLRVFGPILFSPYFLLQSKFAKPVFEHTIQDFSILSCSFLEIFQ